MKKTILSITGLILAVIALTGFALRANHLGEASLWIDEGYSINAATAILERGTPVLDSGRFTVGGLLTSYLVAGVMRTLGFDAFDPWTVRLPSVLFGTGAIIAAYVLARRILQSKPLALASSAIMALSTWEIAWSRQTRGYAAMQCFLLLALYFLWRWLEERKWRDAVLFFLCAAASYFSHSIAIMFVPAFMIAIVAHQILFPDKHLPKRVMVAALVVFAAGVYPFLARHYASLITHRYADDYARTLFRDMPFLAAAGIAGIVFGIFRKRHFWPTCFLAIHLIFPFIIMSWYGQTFQTRYLFPLFPLFVLLAAVLIQTIHASASPWLRRIPNAAQQMLTAGLLLAIAYPSLSILPKSDYPLEWDSPQPNFREAYRTISEQRKEGDLVISPYTPLTRLYLGETGFWLPVSLTGKPAEVERNIINGRDAYTDAPLINNIQELLDLLDERNGFIVADGMARIRLGSDFDQIKSSPNVKEIYHSGEKLSEIWVYGF